MSESRTILTYHDLTVEVESTPSEELIEHMHRTVLGQQGGLRYQHTNLVKRLNAPGENYFIYLRKDGKMLGSIGLCGKNAETVGIRYDSWLIRYFSIKAPMRSVPKKKKGNSDSGDENKRSGILGRFFQPFAANPSMVRDWEHKSENPAIMYGIIEHNNLRSMSFSAQMGMETVGTMANFTFNRIRPRKSNRLEQLPEGEQNSMLAILKEFYQEYTLFFPDPLFKENDYYVIKESGRVVAGIQIYPITWRIVDFGSKMANVLVKFTSKIPWVKKRFCPEDFRMLAFDGIYCENGHESALYELMEGLLERTNTFVAMLMMDKGSELYTIYNNFQKFGILHKVVGTFHADIRIRFTNLPHEVRQYFLDHPTYIPTYDNS